MEGRFNIDAGARKINHPTCLLNSGLYGGSLQDDPQYRMEIERRCEQ